MVWVLRQDVTPFATVHFDISPPCADLSPPADFLPRQGLPYGNYTTAGVEIDDRYWPQQARMKSTRSQLPNMVSFCSFRGFSQAWVNAVEALEPGKHEFRPVKVFRKDGTPLGENYYAVNLRRVVRDAVDFERTTAPSKTDGLGSRLKPLRECDSGNIFMHAEQIRGLHMWISREIALGEITVSDHLFDNLADRRLLGGVLSYRVIECPLSVTE